MTTTTIIILSVLILAIAGVLMYVYKPFRKKIKIQAIGLSVDEFKNTFDKNNVIQLLIENTSSEDKLTAKLFNKNGNVVNPEEIKIKSCSSVTSYEQILNQISDARLKSGLLRIQSTNTAQIINLIKLESNYLSNSVAVPLITQSYFSANQFQSGILDVPLSLILDSDFEMSFTVFANTKVIMSFFIEETNVEKTSFVHLLEGAAWKAGYEVKKKGKILVTQPKISYLKTKWLYIKNSIGKLFTKKQSNCITK